jgi:hypothetical protein
VTACLTPAEVRRRHLVGSAQLLGGTGEHDLAGLEDDTSAGHRERELDVLRDEQHAATVESSYVTDV